MFGKTRLVAGLAVVAGLSAPAAALSAATDDTGSGRAQSATTLYTATTLGTALGTPVVLTTSEGGAPSGTGSFDSEVTATTASGAVLTFVVSSFANAKSAKQEYQNLSQSSSGASPLSGVGDAAVTSSSDTYVLKGAQVLTVSAKPTADKESALNQVKASGGDPEPGFEAIEATAPAAAKAVAAKLTGSGSSASGYVAPPGGINPCVLTGSQVAKLYKASSATAAPVLSDSPPATECRYTITGVGGEDLFITTSDQLYNLSYPTDILSEFVALGGDVTGIPPSSASTPNATNSAERVPNGAAVLVDSVGSNHLHAMSEFNQFFKTQPCNDPKIVQAQDDGSLEISDDAAGTIRVKLVKEAAQAIPPKQDGHYFKVTRDANGNLQFTPTSAPPNYNTIQRNINDLIDNLKSPDGTISKPAAEMLLKDLDTLKKGIRDHCDK